MFCRLHILLAAACVAVVFGEGHALCANATIGHRNDHTTFEEDVPPRVIQDWDGEEVKLALVSNVINLNATSVFGAPIGSLQAPTKYVKRFDHVNVKHNSHSRIQLFNENVKGFSESDDDFYFQWAATSLWLVRIVPDVCFLFGVEAEVCVDGPTKLDVKFNENLTDIGDAYNTLIVHVDGKIPGQHIPLHVKGTRLCLSLT